ncbi:hypothetical protein [Rhodanobacter sp. DHB23]|uniref:hypothetical protein n=1 Tax=Rhodanobacter sp. DHB23 TaxID=2775923 RepID=UPI001780682D|nr:hypothetical protein [Rhodanobacter sp. DHB23]MBD8871202.1 hypothetical protein [Rhodanobacter sp. DHB23]
MDLQAPFVTPDPARDPFFDGAQEETATLSFICQGCSTPIVLNVLQFVSKANSWFRALAEPERAQVIQFFGCTVGEYDRHPVVKSHDPGFPYFGVSVCRVCGTGHLLYVSFYERQYTRYIATFQGAAKVGA